jgi:elongation factor P
MHWCVVYSFADKQSLVSRAAVTSFVLRVGILAQRRGEHESTVCKAAVKRENIPCDQKGVVWDMGLSVSDMRRGMVILYNDELSEIAEYEHSKRGRAGSIARTRLRHLKTGRVTSTTFKGAENTESVFMESRPLQYLYKDGDAFVFMDSDHFDQFPLSKELLGEQVEYIVEGVTVIGYYYNNELVKVELPNFVELRVAQTEPGIRGDTVSNVDKPATLESGAVVQVPLFVKEGDLLKVDTRSGKYVERL